MGGATKWDGPLCGRGLRVGGACVCVEPLIKPDFWFCFGAPDNRRCFDYPDSGEVTLKATDLQRKQDLMKSRKESRTVQHASERFSGTKRAEHHSVSGTSICIFPYANMC